MYEVIFESMQVTLPFTKFKLELLNILRVAPSQIHPSGWALIKAYQFWFQYVKGKVPIWLFLNLFRVSHFKEGGRYGLIGFTQPKRLFEDFRDIPIDFLRRYYSVGPNGRRGHIHLFEMPPVDEEGFHLEECGTCVRKFRRFWSSKHFSLPDDFFIVGERSLTDKVLAMKRTLLRYVDSLEEVLMADPKDPLGKRKVLVKRFIDTELVLSEPSSERRREIF
ncbi:hypothetical protein A2U01_0033000, partial [Trifolium medium]|nr:hypothetical protein [Trifolium medium]